MKNHVAAALDWVCVSPRVAPRRQMRGEHVRQVCHLFLAGLFRLASGASPAFLGFMSKHDKKYCDGDHACEVSILREQIWKLNQEFVNAHNSNPGAYSGQTSRRSKSATPRSTQHPSRDTGGARLRRVGARRERGD